VQVRVLEKSRGLGGRAATRRLHGVRVDHGAQFFTVRDEGFRRRVDDWLASGDVDIWTRGVPTWSRARGWRAADPGGHPRYVCPEGMSTLGRLLGAGVEVERSAGVTSVRREGGVWTATLEDATPRTARSLILTPPLPQSLDLLPDRALSAGDRSELDAVRYVPSFAVMAGYEGVQAPDAVGVRLEDHPDLAWIAVDSSKRARGTRAGDTSTTPHPTVLVLHSTPAFARRRFDDAHDQVAADLLAAAQGVFPWASSPDWHDVHRWRYALVEAPLHDRARSLGDGLVLAGDAFGAARVEGAFLSGLAAADAVLG
jgi:predicted NAD/FAD-dependent oxidoreductase